MPKAKNKSKTIDSGSDGDAHSMTDWRALDKLAISGLSSREEQVLSYAAEGLLDKEIGAEMGVSLNTLRTYWQRIRSKVGEGSRTALAVAYLDARSSAVPDAPESEPDYDWDLDLRTNTIMKVSNRPLWWSVEGSSVYRLEDILSLFHPEDLPNVRNSIEAIRKGQHDAFTFLARGVLPTGIVQVSSYVQVVKDETGVPIRLLGRLIPNYVLCPTSLGQVDVGYWRRDLRTNEFCADENLCRIFRVDPEVPNLRESFIERYEPSERALARRFVSDMVAARLQRARRVSRLIIDEATRWVANDIRVTYQDEVAVCAEAAVMTFD